MADYNRRDALRFFEADGDYMKARVEQGINAHRKGIMTIVPVDSKGNKLEGAHIEVKQTSHEFKYGANLFMVDEFENDDKKQIYRDKFKKTFNLATLPFYWCDLEPENGKPRFAADSPRVYRRPAVDLCLNYCEENGIAPKAHCLNYDPFTPSWAMGMDELTLRKRLERRFAELAERYSGKINGWEVINETLCNNGKTMLYYTPDFVEWSFKLAEKYFPMNELIINEAAGMWEEPCKYNRNSYYMLVDRAIKNGARIDAVGMQFHMFTGREGEVNSVRYRPRSLYANLDNYATLNRPLQITEITIPCYSDSDEDEAIQAELIKNLYSIWFSAANMEAIIYWNLVDGYAYGAVQGDMKAGENTFYGGLLRFDMSEKPAYKMITDLFTKVWRTNLSLDGQYSFPAFYGDYEVSVTCNGKTVPAKFSFKKNVPSPDHFRVVIPD